MDYQLLSGILTGFLFGIATMWMLPSRVKDDDGVIDVLTRAYLDEIKRANELQEHVDLHER